MADGGAGGISSTFGAGDIYISDYVSYPRNPSAQGRTQFTDAQGTIRNIWSRTEGLISGYVFGTIMNYQNTLTISGFAENVIADGNGNNVGPSVNITGDVLNLRYRGANLETGVIESTGTIYNYISSQPSFLYNTGVNATIVKGSMVAWGVPAHTAAASSISSSAVIRNLEIQNDFMQYGGIQEGAKIVNISVRNNGGASTFDRFGSVGGTIQPMGSNRGTFLDCHFNGSSCPALRVGQNAEVWGGTYLANNGSEYSIKPQ
ncbi:MAG: hypothetical protein ACXAD7_27700, partial [Candidatus Kariarchaeaceae archaeon]